MKIVAYYRVSTKRQGDSGLGLDAQRASVEAYAAANMGQIVGEFTEIESGRNKARPKLAEAIEMCRLTGAKLVVAKLDRLARNVAFVSSIMESNVSFLACDNPHANEFTLHILAAVAEHEAKMISKRTKEGLAQARKRGTKLGAENERCRNFKPDTAKIGSARGGLQMSRKCRAYRKSMLPIIHRILAKADSKAEAAELLNAAGYRTMMGRSWDQYAITNMLKGARRDGQARPAHAPETAEGDCRTSSVGDQSDLPAPEV